MTKSPLSIDETAVSEAAYYIWLEEGCPEGKSEEHWHRAREALEPPAPKKPRARKPAAEGKAKPAAKRAAKAKGPSAAAPKAKSAAKPRATRKTKTE